MAILTVTFDMARRLLSYFFPVFISSPVVVRRKISFPVQLSTVCLVETLKTTPYCCSIVPIRVR